MIKSIIVTPLIALALLLEPSQLQAKEGTRLAISHLDTAIIIAVKYHPYINQAGEGLGADLIRAAFAATGLKTEFRIVPPRRSNKMFLHAEADGYMSTTQVFDADQRARIVAVPGIVLLSHWFYFKPNMPQQVTVTATTDLQDQQLGIMVNSPLLTAYSQLGLKTYQIESPEQLIGMTRRGRFDFFESDLLTGLLLIRKIYPQDGEQFGYIPSIAVESSVLFLKDRQRSLNIKMLLELGLARIQKNGDFLAILESYWGQGNVPRAVLPAALKHLGTEQIDGHPFREGNRSASGRLQLPDD